MSVYYNDIDPYCCKVLQKKKSFFSGFSNEQLQSTGIYFIRHIPSNRVYVGSTHQSFRRRWNAHLRELRGHTHHCQHLQRTWDKYGEEEFAFEIVVVAQNGLLAIEQEYLDALLSTHHERCFNVSSKADHPRATLTEDGRLKISQANKDRIVSQATRDQISATLMGRKRPTEVCLKLQQSHKGLRPSDLCMEHRFGRSKAVRRLDTGEIYPSAAVAGRAMGLNANAVRKAISRGCKSGGTYWEHVTGGENDRNAFHLLRGDVS